MGQQTLINPTDTYGADLKMHRVTYLFQVLEVSSEIVQNMSPVQFSSVALIVHHKSPFFTKMEIIEFVERLDNLLQSSRGDEGTIFLGPMFTARSRQLSILYYLNVRYRMMDVLDMVISDSNARAFETAQVEVKVGNCCTHISTKRENLVLLKLVRIWTYITRLEGVSGIK